MKGCKAEAERKSLGLPVASSKRLASPYVRDTAGAERLIGAKDEEAQSGADPNVLVTSAASVTGLNDHFLERHKGLSLWGGGRGRHCS